MKARTLFKVFQEQRKRKGRNLPPVSTILGTWGYEMLMRTGTVLKLCAFLWMDGRDGFLTLLELSLSISFSFIPFGIFFPGFIHISTSLVLLLSQLAMLRSYMSLWRTEREYDWLELFMHLYTFHAEPVPPYLPCFYSWNFSMELRPSFRTWVSGSWWPSFGAHINVFMIKFQIKAVAAFKTIDSPILSVGKGLH